MISAEELLAKLEFKRGDVFSADELLKRVVIWCNLEKLGDSCVFHHMNMLNDFKELKIYFKYEGENKEVSLIRRWLKGENYKDLMIHPIKFRRLLKKHLEKVIQ